MEQVITRRRFLKIAAASSLLPSVALAAAPVHYWQGTALGAKASLALVGVDPVRGSQISARVQAEIDRLESIFSLYRPSSAICTLNERGHLPNPPADFLAILTLCRGIATATSGAFDPTIQPLWRLYAERAQEGSLPSDDEVSRHAALTGFDRVAYAADAIAFKHSGMAITLNGIAQGYITDRISDLLKSEGLADVLVDMGEISAIGTRQDGSPWRAGIVDAGGHIVRRVRLRNRALATSAPLGTLLDPDGQVGHIFDPQTSEVASQWKLVSVSAESAALADGLSTAFCNMQRAEMDRVLGVYPGTRLEALL